MPSREEAREEYRRRVREAMRRRTEAFRGEYGDELRELMGLSPVEVDAITPDTTDVEVYGELIAVVEEASRMNMAQAELKGRIEALGETAVRIARKVPKLADLLG